MVLPRNNTKQAAELIKRYKLKPTTLLKIVPDEAQLSQVSKSSLIKFPNEAISAQELFEYWLDIMAAPSRYMCGIMSHFCPNKMQADKLREFASKTADGKSEYYRYCVRERRSLHDLLFDFGID
mmetsp:Transcript_9283/g.6643  ORF Transcript_9283/g.6643 Transcript_9283/m.6643 type:complete len:124 (+) Transcript_9283:794-1165(+)